VVRYYFLLANMSYKGHDQIYSPNYAVAWPSLVAPVQRGYVGGTYSLGGGTGSGGGAQDYYPNNGYLIEDPDAPSQPWSTANVGGIGNTSPSCQCWGAYNTARAMTPDGLLWIAGTWNVAPSFGPFLSFSAWWRGRDNNALLQWVHA
jgi:hypothetical protein